MNNKYLVFIGMGTELVGIIVVMAYLGKFLDEYLKTNGLMIALMSFAGLGTWIYHITFLLKRLENNHD